MKKFIYLIGLLLAAITVSISNQSCSGGELTMPDETSEPDTRTGSIIRMPTLKVTGQKDRIGLTWSHQYKDPYEFVHIYRSDGEIDMQERPMVSIPMGVDPFHYVLYFFYPTDWGIDPDEEYRAFYYQVAGVSVNTLSGTVTDDVAPYIIHWSTPVVKNLEWVWKPFIPRPEIM